MMKRRILFLLISFFAAANSFSGTFSITGGRGFSNGKKADYIIFEKVSEGSFSFSTDSLALRGLKCYKITLGEEKIDSLLLKADEYTLSTDSQTVTFNNLSANTGYLIQYKDYSYGEELDSYAYTCVVEFKPLQSVSFPKDTVICSDLELAIEPVMEYFNEYGNTKKINRTLSVKYKSFLLKNEFPSVEEVTEEKDGTNSIQLSAMPYVDTPFEVTDLTANNDLKMNVQPIVTDTFYTQAVVAYPYMETHTKYEHEGDEGTDSTLHFYATIEEAMDNVTKFRQSATLVLNLYSYPSDMVNHYEWAFAEGEQAKNSDFQGAYTYFGKDINAFEISEPILHCIELTVSNIRNDSVCEHKSYACLQIAKSQLYVPNAFTPNGDNINDEFRVGYRSIESFEISIYDQWGRRVYKSDDITKGWDGTFRGDKASIGAYYYVIKAKGTDGEKYLKKGTISLIRSKE
ncbi:MAG: gliding motility-associated C-terminal domain-containing protein [Paludibacteraceae bacterium]|nr:gliding motility-associated C-terminal domain-containing protein [Paludibacteraceae bacterium]